MRWRTTSLFAILLATPFTSVSSAAQSGTIRVETRLVEINVVVRDKNGPVANLAQEDFTILDNGKPQRIDLFVPSDSRARKAEGNSIPPGVVANRLDAGGEVPQGATAILLDLMNSSLGGQSIGDLNGEATSNLSAINDQRYAVAQLVAYLRTIREGDRVALFVLGNQLHLIQDFTGDPEILFGAASRLKALDVTGIEVSTVEQLAALLQPPPVANEDGSVTFVGDPGFANAISVISSINRAVASADAFEAISRHMSGLEGRKSLVWLSAGFPFRPAVAPRIVGVAAQAPVETPDSFLSQVERASRALNEAGVSIYPVDYQGLKGGYPEVMVRLASATGGDVAYRTNDLQAAVSTAVADGDVSYTLGFYLATDRLDGKSHDLKVKVNREDVSIHHRSAYYAAPVAVPEKQRQSILSELIGATVNSSQIGLVALAEPDSTAPGTYRITISIDPANLNLTQEGDRRTGKLGIVMRLESSKSKNTNVGTIPLSFSEEQFQNVRNRGFVVRQSVQAARGDRLRIVVQDQTTGLAGAVWLPLTTR